MSSDSTKKRRIADEGSNNDDNGVGSDGSSTAAIIAEMKEHLMCMQNKMDGMESRLSRMDELEKKCQQQEERCNILEDKCDSLVSGMKVLMKENKWEYSAPPIPTSHWTGLGFDAVYIESMEDLVHEIRNKTNIMREEEDMDCITLGDSSNVSGTVLQYDNVLLPHWEELATALQLCQNSKIEFTIQNVQLIPSVMDLLITAFKGKLNDLFLDNNEFLNIHEGTEFIVTCIQSNRQMTEFCLLNNQLGSAENARSVLDAIISHPSINYIRLENCLGGEEINGYDMLCSLLASGKPFDTVDFERNSIQTNGDTSIPDCIANNPPLKSLFLSGNKLNDNDAILIAQALKHNTKLEDLHLYRNDFTDIGGEAILKAVYDPTSLNSVSECNHTCQIKMDGSAFGRGLPHWCTNSGAHLPCISISNPKWIRSRKIHYILSSRHRERSNVQHLNTEFKDDAEDSLKLAPKVLEAVYKHSNKRRDRRIVHPLTIMYEILRGWKMPELYGNR